MLREHGPHAAVVADYASRSPAGDLVENQRRITVAGLNEGMDASRGDCWIIIGAHSKVRADFVRSRSMRCSGRARPVVAAQ